jgi:hypothetical protein
MDLVVPWLIFPIALGAVALGLGLLLERAAEIRVPGVLVLPVGFAVLIVVAQFATLTDFTAELATPVAIVLAVAGFALSNRRRERRVDGWAIAAAVGAFAAFAAPVVLSGEATFAGYAKLDDTATWFALTDHVMEHGRNVDAVDPSTYQLTLERNLSAGYPIGTFVPLGVGRAIVGQDVAWVFQAYMAFLAIVLALSLYAIATRMVESRPLAALVAFLATQAAILFGYSLWGGVKEMAAAALLALVGATAPIVLERPAALGAAAPLAFAGAALLGVLSLGGIVWLLPIAGALVLAALRLKGVSFTFDKVGSAVLLAGVLALPSIVTASFFIEPARGTLLGGGVKGLLFHSLSPLQIFGIWPTGDFRNSPKHLTIADILILVTALGAVASLYFAWRKRAWGLLAYVGTAAISCFVIAVFSSPWVDGKTYAIVSPAFVLAGLCGAVALSGRARVLSAVAVVAIGAGVVWSNVLAYHDVNLAPRERLSELADMGDTLDGAGPTLMLPYEPYATKHFLRKSDPEGIYELKSLPINLQSTAYAGKLYADIDQIHLKNLLAFRTIVMPRSPIASRPPVQWQLVKRMRFYEIWQRSNVPDSPRTAWLQIGNLDSPSAVPECSDVLKVLNFAGPGARLAVARTPTPILVALGQSQHPSDWRTSAEEVLKIVPTSKGNLETLFAVPRDGRYDVWFTGSFRARVEASIDGRPLWSDRHVINRDEYYFWTGSIALRRGQHRLMLRYSGPDSHPGSGGRGFPLGPFALRPADAESKVSYLPARRGLELCGKSLDWIEIL